MQKRKKKHFQHFKKMNSLNRKTALELNGKLIDVKTFDNDDLRRAFGQAGVEFRPGVLLQHNQAKKTLTAFTHLKRGLVSRMLSSTFWHELFARCLAESENDFENIDEEEEEDDDDEEEDNEFENKNDNDYDDAENSRDLIRKRKLKLKPATTKSSSKNQNILLTLLKTPLNRILYFLQLRSPPLW